MEKIPGVVRHCETALINSNCSYIELGCCGCRIKETRLDNMLIKITDTMKRIKKIQQGEVAEDILAKISQQLDSADENSALCLCPLHFGDCEHCENGRCNSPLI